MNINEMTDNTSHAATPRSFGKAIATCLSKYATFKGRASRSEFWWFYLFVILSTWGANIVVSLVTGNPILGVYASMAVSLALWLPFWASSVRRLHDVGRSGWWLLIALTIIGSFVLLYWWVQPGKPEQNEY